MASPSNRPARPRPTGSRPSGGASRQTGNVSRPWRLLATLLALLIVMFATIIGGEVLHPGDWHDKFKVGLGLDLHGGTSITLKAVSSKGGVPTQAAMNQAIGILTQRFEPLGVSNISVQQQGSQFINVSIPGKAASQISPLLTAAVLEFRQVLLCTTLFPGSPSVAPGPQCATTLHGPRAKAGLPSAVPTIVPTPVPSPSASGAPAPLPSPSGSSPKAPKTTPATSPAASPSASSSAGGSQAVRAVRLAAVSGARAASSPSPSASPSPNASSSPAPSSSPSPSGSASPSPSGSPSPSASPTPTFYISGNQSLVTAAALADFKKLDCSNPDWQSQIYGDKSSEWNNPNTQIVGCDKQGMKYVLGTAIVSGKELTSESAGLLSSTNQWVVNFGFNGKGTKAFADKTIAMNTAYWTSGSGGYQTSVLNQFAIVLDGKIISAPTVQQAITQGTGQISGNFTSKSAASLANVLKYGQLPISFRSEQINSVSAELGATQLDAGLIAAAVGLLLVILYSLLYYRGLAVVSVFSLALAALLSWLSVIVLGKYVGYTLSLAGVAGLIVAIGITADSFVVYFERLRDEVREGRSLRAAVERGWERARRTILVSDTVSFLAALLLYIFAIGDVRGFAFTLGLTTLIDIVVVFLFTKPMVTLLARTDFFGRGHKWSGLDPARLGGRAPWRGSRSATARPATGSAASARTTPKEA